MKRIAAVIVALALLAALWWSTGAGDSTVEALAPPAPVVERDGQPVERVEPGELERSTRSEAAAAVPDAPAVAVVETPAIAKSVLARGEAEIVVRVIAKEDQSPIARARVLLQPDPPPHGFSSRHVEGSVGRLGEAPATDAEGIGRFVVEPGKAHKVSVFDPQRIESVEADVPSLAEGENRTVVLEGATRDDTRWFGRVVADDDGRPIAGAVVDLRTGDHAYQPPGEMTPTGALLDAGKPPETTVASDAEGRFMLAFKSWRQLHARIVAPGRAVLYCDLAQGHETFEKALELRLRPSAGLEVRVVDGAGGAISGVAVRASTHAYHLQRKRDQWVSAPDPAWESPTGADGRARFVDLPAGAPLTIELVRDRKVVRRDVDSVTLAPGEDEAIVVALGGGARIRGRIVDQDGKPVVKHDVWLNPAAATYGARFQGHEQVRAKTRSDANGEFAFDDVAPGEWAVGPAPKNRYGRSRKAVENDFAPIAKAVSIAPGSTEVVVVVETHRGLVIRGRVVDPAGKAAGGGTVHARASDGQSAPYAQVDEDGSFVLGPLTPGEYHLSAYPSHMTATSRSEEVLASPGELEVVLRLRPGGKVSGTIVDRASGKPCDGEVTISPSDAGTDWSGIQMTTSREGKFELGGLALRTYTVAVRVPDGRCGSAAGIALSEAAATPTVEIAVEPGATLRVRCEGTQGSASFQVHSNGVCFGFDGVEAGSVSEQAIPAGTIVVRTFVGVNLPPAEQTVEIAKGETREVVVQPNR